MAYPTRSLDDFSKLVRGAFRQYLPGTDATLRQNVLYVIAKVLALLFREAELRTAWIYRQLFLSTATDLGMVRMHAADYRIFQKPASVAAGKVIGTGAPNATYPAGVRFVSGSMTFVTSAPFTAGATGLFAASTVSEQTGLAANRDAGAELNLADAALYPALSATVTVAAGGLGGGADVEDIESLRARALDRKARPPQGGALSDYEQMALAVPGVATAWARQFANGIGSVGVWFLFAGRPNGVPAAADVAVVQDAINARRLIRGAFYALAPTPVKVDLTIQLSPDTARERAAVTLALQSFFDATRRGTKLRPGFPSDPFLLSTAWISEVISTTAGEANHTLIEPDGPLAFQAGVTALTRYGFGVTCMRDYATSMTLAAHVSMVA